MLEICHASRRFGSFTVFRDVSLTVPGGTATAIVGANGTGKSTLLRCAAAFDDVDDGRVRWDGHDIDETSPSVRADIAAVIDDVASFPHLSVREHLLVLATAHGVDGPGDAADAALGDVGLSDEADRLPVTLSSGQRKRWGLASAFVRPRRLLVLDEPESHLDAAGRAWLAKALVDEKRRGVAVLFVSHDQELVGAVADTIVDGDSWR